MERQTRLANVVDSAGNQIQYDECVKTVLANKAILAWILKCCVKEFASFSLNTIMGCIEGTPEIAKKAVHKDEADVPLSGNEEIRGDNTEDNSSTEQTITYDIRFTAVVPDKNETVDLIINVEAQKQAAGYPIEKRVVYYLSRLISGQYGTVFTHSHYEKIQKVYSIWLCGSSPDYKKNTISGISLQGNPVFGEDTLRHEAVDLMQGIIVNLGDANEGADNEILHLMNTLLSDEISADQKKKVLKEDFNIAMTEELESGVSEMCNLSQGILEKGIEKGRQEEKNKILQLMQRLFADGRTADAERASSDPAFLEQLLQEYSLKKI